MAYVINNTRGTAITTITDGTVDNTTSLQLFGKSYSGFGEGLNENLVKLLENSASSAAPSAPLAGELWFDTATSQIKVYDGTSWKPTGSAKSQATQPSLPSAGDLWSDSTNKQLYFYTGTAWQLVGPDYTAGQTLSGWKIETVNDSAGVSKVISSMYVGNTRVAVLSKETFTPQSGSPSGSPLATNGFATISAGLNLNSTLSASFAGNSSQAVAMDISSTTNTSATVIAGGNFLRSDAADTTTGALTIDTDSGIIVGDAQELTVTVASGNVILAQTRQDKDLSITVNDGGVTKTPLTFTGSSGAIGLTGDVTITGNLTITGSYDKSSVDVSTYVDAFIGLNEGNATDVDGGLIVEKASGEARIFWDTSESYWSAGTTGSYSQVIRLADATTDGDANKEKVLKTDSSGRVVATYFARPSVETITTSNTATVDVPSTGAVVNLINSEQPKWGSSAKTVSTSAPTSGDGSDGDFWFVREA
jgi:hypothetical protein